MQRLRCSSIQVGFHVCHLPSLPSSCGPSVCLPNCLSALCVPACLSALFRSWCLSVLGVSPQTPVDWLIPVGRVHKGAVTKLTEEERTSPGPDTLGSYLVYLDTIRENRQERVQDTERVVHSIIRYQMKPKEVQTIELSVACPTLVVLLHPAPCRTMH